MSQDSRVFVVSIDAIRKHENADTLSIVDVFGGYPCIVRTGDFQTGDLAVYVPIDMCVPDTDLFKFYRTPKHKAGESVRIKAKRLRGVFSMGILVRAPEGVSVGDDVTEALGITKWEPEELPSKGPSRPGGKFLPGDAESDPGFLPAYTDIESLRRWKHVLDGDEVVVTEKIHGANAGFVWHAKSGDPRLWVRSRRQFKKPDGGGIWAEVAKQYHFDEVLREVCPGVAIFGEVYGQVQDLTYGFGDRVNLVAFDAFSLSSMKYLDYDHFNDTIQRINEALSTRGLNPLSTAPLLYRGQYDFDTLSCLAEGPTVLGKGHHTREGFVIRPIRERYDSRLGRIILKLVGEGYLTR